MTRKHWPGLRARLFAAFIGVALFTGCLGAYAISAVGQINDRNEQLRHDEFGGIDLAAQYASVIYEARLKVVAYLLATDVDQRAALHAQILLADQHVAAITTRLATSNLNQSDVERFAAMVAAWDAYKEWRNQYLFADYDPSRWQAAYYSSGIKLTDAIVEKTDLFFTAKRAEVVDLTTASRATYEQTRAIAIGLTVLAISAAMAIGYFLSRSITRAVGQAARAAQGLAAGDLDQHLDVRSTDELGDMADAFRQMIEYQRHMAAVAAAIADGDLNADVVPQSAADELGNAFQRMSRNLRMMVSRLEHDTQRLSAQAQLLDLAHSAIIVRDPDTAAIRYWNRGAEELYGWSASEVLGKSIHSLLQTEFPESHDAIDRELRRTQSSSGALTCDSGRWDGELVQTRKDGTRLRALSRQATQHDSVGNLTAVLEINTDVTHRHEAALALAEARDAAEAASQSKSEFLANTSHEIRTPMNAILGMAELLAETPLNDEQREYVRTFQRAGDNLLTLINDVLDLSKIEAGQLEFERIGFDLAELVEQTAEVVAVRAHAKGLELTVHVLPGVPTWVNGDPTRLRQVLMNLLGNAIKFTDRGEVVLRVQPVSGSTDRNMVEFSVCDSGMGIPADKQTAIFESFVQADASTTRRHGGTGLGLTISSHIVEIMGGKLTVVSQLGQGSTFSFTIPLDRADAAECSVTKTAIDMRDWRVLVADDNETNRLILRELLTESGAVVVEAQDGIETLAVMRAAREQAQPFRLVLLDGRMPGLDGFQVAAHLREEVDALGETIVMLTSDNRAGDVVRARQLGLAAYVVKPIKRAELMRTIAAVAGRPHAAPSATAAPSVAAVPDESDPTVRSLRLLLVEDSADNRMLIKAYLKKLPYQIDFAEDGQAGLDLVRNHDYDLVLMDMLMPVMDGLQATRAIRAWERETHRPATPVVALTANAMDEDVRRCLEAGCDAHVAKPIKKAALLAAVQHYAAVR